MVSFVVFSHLSKDGSKRIISGEEFERRAGEMTQKIDGLKGTLLDDETQFVDAKVGPGKRVTYYYKLVKRSNYDMNADAFKEFARKIIVSTYKTHEKMQSFRDNNVELHYYYSDWVGRFFCEVVVSPKDF